MKFKKLMLSIGSLATIAAPVAAVISCGEPGSSEYPESDLLKMSNLKSSEAHSKLTALWLARVSKDIYGFKDEEVSNFDFLSDIANTTSKNAEVGDKFTTDFKTTLEWVLKNKLFSSKDALSSIYSSIKSNAPESLLSIPANEAVIDGLNTKIFNKSEIDTTINGLFKTDAWKDIFYNIKTEPEMKDGKEVKDKNGKTIMVTTFNPSILGLKDLVMKMIITKNYLSISSRQSGDALPDEKNKLSSKFKDSSLINPDVPYFPLVVSTMNSRLAYKTSISLGADESKEFIVANIDNNLDDAKKGDVFSLARSAFKSKLTYTIKHQTIVDDIIARVPSFFDATSDDTKKDTIGFQGLSSLPTGEDNLDTNTVGAIKLVKDDANARDGFVVDSKLVDKDIRFTDEDKTKVEVNYYTSLMPVFNTEIKSLDFMQNKISGTTTTTEAMDEAKLDILMNEVYTKDSSLYSSAIKYFTSNIKDGDTILHAPLLVKVTNDWARNYYIDEGLTYVDPEGEK